jgi:hypothetical protein
VLRQVGTWSPHETPINITKLLRALLAASLCVFLPDQALFPTPQGHLYRTTLELSATLPLSPLGALLSRISPGPTPNLLSLN